jgi:hypothetical protein
MSTRRSPFQILYGIQPRGVSELRVLEQGEIRSTRAEDFAAKMQKLHSRIKEQLQSSNQKYKHRVISIAGNFNLKWVMQEHRWQARRGGTTKHVRVLRNFNVAVQLISGSASTQRRNSPSETRLNRCRVFPLKQVFEIVKQSRSSHFGSGK